MPYSLSVFLFGLNVNYFCNSYRSRGPINSRFISNAFSSFSRFPLLSSYSFAIPHSNVIVPPFPSPAIQSDACFSYSIS
jgi:hypothetical protein